MATQTPNHSSASTAYLRVLRKWWWLPVLFGLLSAGVTYAGSLKLIKPEYGATLTLEVVPPGSTPLNQNPADANAAAAEMTQGTIKNLAWYSLTGYDVQGANIPSWLHQTCPPPGTQSKVSANCVGASDYKAMWKQVSCLADTSDRFVTCTTTSRNYLVPPSVLGALASTFQKWNHYNVVVKSGTQEKVFITGPAVASKAPVSPHPLRNALLGFVVGLGIAAALIVFMEYLDDSFHSIDEIGDVTGLPLLGAVRKYEGSAEEMGNVASRMPRTAIAEAYRVARANIQFADTGDHLKVILVTSARDGEGKTTTANNLATTFALAGQRVLLVDSDLRRPGLTKIWKLRDNEGVSAVLLDPDADVICPTDVVGLSVVPCGALPPNPAELLSSNAMREWIDAMERRFDLIILDTPPVLSVADTRILATLADGVILVLDPALTTRRMVKQARMAVDNVGGRILGIMLNRDVMRGEGYYYNYYYYYGQTHERGRERERSR